MRAMAGHRESFRSQLLELARAYNVQTAYTDFWGQRRRAEPEALLAVLRALGAGVETLRDVPDALQRASSRVVAAGLSAGMCGLAGDCSGAGTAASG